MERRHLLSTGMALALGGLLPAAGSAEAAVNTKRGLLINGVTGSTVNRAGQTGTFTGTLLIKRLGFDNETRTLKVYGLVSGTSTTAGEVVNQRFASIATLTSEGPQAARQARPRRPQAPALRRRRLRG